MQSCCYERTANSAVVDSYAVTYTNQLNFDHGVNRRDLLSSLMIILSSLILFFMQITMISLISKWFSQSLTHALAHSLILSAALFRFRPCCSDKSKTGSHSCRCLNAIPAQLKRIPIISQRSKGPENQFIQPARSKSLSGGAQGCLSLRKRSFAILDTDSRVRCSPSHRDSGAAPA